MGRKKKLVPGAATTRYERGETLEEIAESYGLSVQTVRKRLAERGVTFRAAGRRAGIKSGPRNPDRLAAIREMRGRGMTYQDIAVTLGVTRQAIHNMLKTHA